MDLGIAGKTALVCGASKGLGKGCAQALVREGVNVVIMARGAEALEATAAELRALRPRRGARGRGRHHDRRGPRRRARRVPQVDILVNNAGGPPPGDFRDWDRDAWIKALDANMLTPIELIKATVDGMAARGFGRIVNITSGAVKAPIDMLGLSQRRAQRASPASSPAWRAARIAARGVTINNLLPGAVRHRPAARHDAGARSKAGPALEPCAQRAASRSRPSASARADEFGAVCAFLCSVQAGYLTGQNMLLDGGAYPGTF